MNGVVKSPIYFVAVIFQNLNMYAYDPEKPLRLVYGTFYNTIIDRFVTFYETISS